MNKTVIILVSFIIFSCQPSEKTSVETLFEADRSFSKQAEEIGYAKAFIEHAHPDAVLLRENSLPLKGKPAITQVFKNANSEGIHFTWEPMGGDIALSGEMGYTYGIYKLSKDTLHEKGTYVSIWKKDENNIWKYVLDSGNEGTGN